MSAKHADTGTPPHGHDIDRLLIQSLGRWSILITAILIVFDVLILSGYPFPSFVDGLRGVAYTLVAVLLLGSIAGMTFLGYRLVTLRVATSRREVFPVFLPLTALLASVVGFLLMSAPK